MEGKRPSMPASPPSFLAHAKHRQRKLERLNRRRALPIAKQAQEHKEIKGLTPATLKRLQLCVHLLSFFANRLNKHLIAGSLEAYQGRPMRRTEHSPSKDLEALSKHASELLDIYEDILYTQDLQQ